MISQWLRDHRAEYNSAVETGRDATETKICEICGYEGNPEELVVRRIAPGEVDRQDGILDIRTVLLCTNCSNEWYSFCSKKVHDVIYDNVTKHFMHKSPTELTKEYEVAYKAFTAYKKKW